MKCNYPIEVYPKEVLIKTAFHFLDRAYIHIDVENDSFVVDVQSKPDEKTVTKGEFDNEMIVQAARYFVALRTKTIREITLGRAMASTIIDEADETNELPLTEDDFDVDKILSDWFDDEQ